MRICKVCKIEKPYSEMVISMTGKKKTHYKWICRICHRRNSDIVNALRKDHPYPDENYACPICKEKNKKWYLDHDWSTGNFRAWLCNHCNSGLGNFKDDISLLNTAIAYLSPVPKWYEHG
jgi:hypothetical protein